MLFIESQTMKIYNTILTTALLIISTCATVAMSDTQNPILHPGYRFTRENIHDDTLAFWPDDVTIQFAGIRENSVRQEVLLRFLSLADAAKVNINIVGFPDNIFDGGRAVKQESNILVFEFNSDDKDYISSGIGEKTLNALDLTKSNAVIHDILRTGLADQGNGCFVRWKASSKNEILGFVLAVTSEVSEEQKVACLSTISPTAFGVMPNVSSYNVSNASTQSPNNFSDTSEIYLELSSAAFCRKEFSNYGGKCPFDLMNSVFKHHAELLEIFGAK